MCHSFASLKDRSEFAVGERAFSPELAVALSAAEGVVEGEAEGEESLILRTKEILHSAAPRSE